MFKSVLLTLLGWPTTQWLIEELLKDLMTILGYSSSSLERVRRHHLQPPARHPGHQVPAERVPQPAGLLHPEHLQQDEGDGERPGGSSGNFVSKGLFTKFCQDKLYELDKSWENNLVIYGINQMKEEEERPSLMESRVREILRYFVADSY